MAENKLKIVWETQGSGELARSIKGVASAISSLDFNKLSEIAGVSTILSNLKNNKVVFDVSTGSGIQKSIEYIRNLLFEMNKYEELRKAMSKNSSPYDYFNTVSQTSISIPKTMTDKNLKKMQGIAYREMKNTDDVIIESEVRDIYLTIKRAREHIRKLRSEGNIKGLHIDELTREYVEVFSSFNDRMRSALSRNIKNFQGMSGRVGDAIGTVFKTMSPQVRDKVIMTYKDEEIKIGKRIHELLEKIKVLEKVATGASGSERSKTELNKNEQELAFLITERDSIKKTLTQMREAKALLAKEDRDNRAAQGAMKNVQSARVRADVLADSDDLAKVFKDILFINNKASAKQVADVLKEREKDLIDFYTRNKPYKMNQEELINFTTEGVAKQQDILRYRELLNRKYNIVSESEFNAMREGKKIYDVPANFNDQTIDKYIRKLEGFTFQTNETDAIINTLENLRKISKKFSSREKIFLTDAEMEEMGKAMLEFAEIPKKITSAQRRAKNRALHSAKSATSSISMEDVASTYSGKSDELISIMLKQYQEKIKKLKADRSLDVKQVSGIDKDDAHHLERIKAMSQEIADLEKIIALTKEYRSEMKLQNKEAVNTEKKVSSKVVSEAKKKEKESISEEEKIAQARLSGIEREEKIKLAMATIDQQVLVSEGMKVNLTQILIAKKELMVRQSKIEEEIEANLFAMGKDRLLYDQKRTAMKEHEYKINHAINDKEREQYRLEYEEYKLKLDSLDISTFELEKEKHITQEHIARANVLIQSKQSHKKGVLEVIKEYVSLEKLASRITFVLTAMFSYGTVNKIKSELQSGYNEAVKLNNELARLKSIMNEFEKASVDNIKNTILNLSATYGQTLDDLGKAMYAIQSAQITGSSGQRTLEESTKMATAGLSSQADATDLLISVVNAYGLSVDNISRASDMFFQLVKYGRTTIQDLGKGFGNVASTGALLGVSLEDISTSLAIMTNQGIKTDQAMTALNRLMTNFARGGTKETRQIAKELGISMDSSAIKAEGLYGLLKKLENANERQIMAISGNVRAFKALATGINDTSKFLSFHNQITNSYGSTQEALNEIMEGAEFKLKKLKQELVVNTLKMSEGFIPIIIKLQGLLNGIITVFSGLGSKVIVTAGAIGLFTIALNAMKKSLNATAAAAALLNIQMTATRKIAALSFPIVGIALSLLSAVIWDFVEKATAAKKSIESLDQVMKDIEITTISYLEEDKKVMKMYEIRIKSLIQNKKVLDESTTSEARKVAILKDVKRNLGELQKEYPKYFSELKIEQMSLDNIATSWDGVKNAINNTTIALNNNLKIAKIVGKINAMISKSSETETEILELRTNITDDVDKIKKKVGDVIKGKLLSRSGFTDNLSKKDKDNIIKDINNALDDVIKTWMSDDKNEMSVGAAQGSIVEKIKEKYGAILDPQGPTVFVHSAVKIPKSVINNIKKIHELSNIISALDEEIDKASLVVSNLNKEDLSRRIVNRSGGDDDGGGQYEYKNLLKVITDEYERRFESVNVEDFSKIVKGEREKEKELFQKGIDVLKKITDKDERDRAVIDFVNWIYNNKKERLSRIMTVLNKQMESAEASYEEDSIKKEMDVVMNEILLNMSQYMAFDIDKFNANEFRWVERTKLFIDGNDIVYQSGSKKYKLQSLGSGKFLADFESILSSKGNVITTLEKMIKEHEGNKTGKKNIVEQWIFENFMNYETGYSLVLGKASRSVIDKFLLTPFLPSDAKSLADDYIKKFDEKMSAIKKENERRLFEMQDILHNNESSYRDLFSGNVSFSGIVDALFIDINREQYEKNVKQQKLDDAYANKANYGYMSDEDLHANEQEIINLENEIMEDRKKTLKTSIDAMKEMWTMFYSWQMDKIKEWYDNQVKRVDNRAKYEYRSSLWLEKEKEKLDKRRIRKERALTEAKRSMSIAEIIFNTGSAIMRAMKDFGFPLGLIPAAFIGGMGAGQIALASKQKFGKGGKIYGASHHNKGVNIEAEGGEFMFSKKAVAGNEAILYTVQRMLETKQSFNPHNDILPKKLDALIKKVGDIDIQATFTGEVLSDVKLFKKTVRGQRMMRGF